MSKSPHVVETRRLQCQECNLPVSEVRAGSLIIRGRHHGQAHTSTFSLEWLRKQLELSADDSGKITCDAT